MKRLATMSFLLALTSLIAIAAEPTPNHPKRNSSDISTDDGRDSPPKKHPFRVRVIDSSGAAVADAKVGQMAGRLAQPDAEWQFAGVLGSHGFEPAVTNVAGETEMFVDDIQRSKLALVARHASRKIVGLHIVSRNELLSASNDRSTVTVLLQPECRIHGRLLSRGLESLGKRLKSTVTNATVEGVDVFEFDSRNCEFEFFLPPGQFSLGAVGNETSTAYRSFTVETAIDDLELEPLDLPPTNMAKLVGRPAPELHDVVAWKNSKPLKLADLRGQYVLLDFWGWWCDGCVHRMKDLFALHDRFGKRGLVIIGVHVGTDDEPINSVEELNAKIAATRQHVWAGRDVPYPVAVVASRRTNHPGSEQQGRSQAAADFGVIFYPSEILIDPDGRVVGWFDEKEHVKLFEKRLK